MALAGRPAGNGQYWPSTRSAATDCPRGRPIVASANTLRGGLDVELLQLAELRPVFHREAVAEVEHVVVLESGQVLDLPPIVVEGPSM